MKQFSIVMPFRDMPRERKFAETSIPAAIKLNPSEIVIGVDAPTVESFLDHIHNICKQESFDRIKIMEVHRSNKWNFQLVNVMWRCYNACSYGIILAFDVDTTLLPTILRGYLWAITHSKHESVCIVANSTFYDWSLTGSKFITGLHDWSKMGRAGTGFA